MPADRLACSTTLAAPPQACAGLGNLEPLLEGVLGSDQADGRLRTNVRCTCAPRQGGAF
jgi:hypothetical protein